MSSSNIHAHFITKTGATIYLFILRKLNPSVNYYIVEYENFWCVCS